MNVRAGSPAAGSRAIRHQDPSGLLRGPRTGGFEYGAPTGVVEEVTGRPAEPFDATVRRYLNQPIAQRTLGNRVRSFFNFMRVPFTPSFDVKGFEERQFQPPPPSPLFAMQDKQWKAEHGAMREVLTAPLKLS